MRYLASHLLGEVARRIAADWRQKYGNTIVMLETFVERDPPVSDEVLEDQT